MSGLRRGGSRVAAWVGAALLAGSVVVGLAAGGLPDAAGRPDVAEEAGSGTSSAARPNGPAASHRMDAAPAAAGARAESFGETAAAYLEPGDGYPEIAARLGPASEHDPVALFLLGEAASVCVSESRPDAARRARTATARAFVEWKVAFCRGQFAGPERRDAILRKRMAGLTARHPEWKDVGDSPGGTSFFDAVLSGTSLDEMQIAISMLSVGEHWELGHDLVDGTPLEADLSRYQEIALESLMCDVTGGCGPNGLRTAMLCVRYPEPTCHPERSLYDTWNDRFAPDEIAVIVALRERIVAARARHPKKEPD